MTNILKEYRKEGTLFERLQMKGFSLHDIFWFMELYELNEIPFDRTMMKFRMKQFVNAHIHLNYINNK